MMSPGLQKGLITESLLLAPVCPVKAEVMDYKLQKRSLLIAITATSARVPPFKHKTAIKMQKSQKAEHVCIKGSGLPHSHLNLF